MDKVHVLNKLYEYGGFNTKAEFADFLDLSPQNLSNWYNRKTFDINLLSNKFTNVNRNWLLTGEGEMLMPKTESIETNTTDVISIPISVWQVISNQAESLKSKDRQLDTVLESLKVKDRQTTEVIELLKEQIKKGEGVDENYHAATQAVGE